MPESEIGVDNHHDVNSVQHKKTKAKLEDVQDNEYRPPNNIILVGTKLDLVKGNHRQVSYDEGLNFAKKLNIAGFIETSAK